MRVALLLVLLAHAPSSWCQSFTLADVPRPPGASSRFGSFVDGAGGLLAVGDPGAERVFIFRRDGDQLVLDGHVVPERLTTATDFGAIVDLGLSPTRIFVGGSLFTLAVGAPGADSFEVYIRCRNGRIPDQTFPPRPGTNDPGFFAPLPCQEGGWSSFDFLNPGNLSFNAGETGIGTGVQFENDTVFIGTPRGLREDEMEEPFPDGTVIILDYFRLAALGTMGVSQSTAGTFLTPPDELIVKGGVPVDFGASVAVQKGKFAVGAPGANLGAGLAGLYERVATNLEDPLGVSEVDAEPGPAPGARFGASVSLDPTFTVAVGSPGIDRGEVTLLQFEDPDSQVALDAPTDASDFGSSVQLAGDLAIIGAVADGKPTAILRSVSAKGGDIRLDGNVVAIASRQFFSAADQGAGTVQAALDSETIYRNGMEF